MAFEMHPPSSFGRIPGQFSIPRKAPAGTYAKLDSPFEQPAFDSPYHDYTTEPGSSYAFRPTHANRGSSYVSELGPGTPITPYDSRTFLNQASGYGGGHQSPPAQYGHPWQPGFFKRFPWLGLSSLVGTVLCTFAAVAVLVISNGRPIDSWSSSLQPTVYLSISSALANILLTYALYQGIIISFWHKAGQGATLLELHQYWHSGSSFWGAIHGVFLWRGVFVSMACIFTVISILRGPLMQRASNVSNVLTHSNGTVTVHAAPQLPYGWAGTDTGRTSSASLMNPNFTAIVDAYSKRQPISITHSDCGSTCQTSIEGFGLGVSCNRTGTFYDLAPALVNGSYEIIDPINIFQIAAGIITVYGHGAAAELDQYGFPMNNTDPAYETNTALLLNVTFIANPSLGDSYNGTMTHHLCALRAGIVSYPVTITNNTVTLQSTSWRNDTFLEDRGFLTLPYNQPSNLAGFELAANNMYTSSASYQFGGAVSFILNIQGSMANLYLRRPNYYQDNDYLPGLKNNHYDLDANISFRDPMDDMIDGMRELAFRSMLDVANWNLTMANSTKEYYYTGSQPQTIYVSNYRYMAAAVAVSLAGVIAVIPTYGGWWHLGRQVTLSPLEVAKAFDAPLLAGVESNVGAERMLKDVGGNMVRYGDVLGGIPGAGAYVGERRKLQILNADLVRKPEKGVRYT